MNKTITIRFALTKGEGQFPTKKELSKLPNEKLNEGYIHSCMSFDPSGNEFQDQISKVEMLFDGLAGGSVGPGVGFKGGEITGYPAPVVRFVLKSDLNEEILLKDVWESGYKLNIPGITKDAFYFQDYNGYSSIINLEHLADSVTEYIDSSVRSLIEGEKIFLDKKKKWEATCKVMRSKNDFIRKIFISDGKMKFTVVYSYFSEQEINDNEYSELNFEIDDCEYLEDSSFIVELYNDLNIKE